MRAFAVRLPSGVRYWTVLDDGLRPHPAADAFLRHVRLGRDGAESTTQAYATSIALFLTGPVHCVDAQPARAAPWRAGGPAPSRRARPAGVHITGLSRRSGAGTRPPAGGQRQSGLGQIPTAASGTDGPTGGPGPRPIPPRASALPSGGRFRFPAGEPVQASRPSVTGARSPRVPDPGRPARPSRSSSSKPPRSVGGL